MHLKTVSTKRHVSINKINKKAVEHSFSKAAQHYDHFSQLQRYVGEQLFKKIEKTEVENIIDLGCGTGFFSERLLSTFPDSQLLCFDISPVMLQKAKQLKLCNTTYLCADIDDLSQFNFQVDLIFSNMVVQWSDDLSAAIYDIYQQLACGGKVYISTLLDGSLQELATAWKQVDSYRHINQFKTEKDLCKIVSNSAFKHAKLTRESRVLEYKTVIELMHALKGMGANHVHGYKPVNMNGHGIIKKLELGYLPFKTARRLLPLTFQVCYIELTK